MRRIRWTRGLFVSAAVLGLVMSGAAGSLLGVCGPFTDVANDSFCSFVLEIFYVGLTTGTTPTTYNPSGTVSRLQMAAFLSRGVDATLKRGSRRAALKQFWTTQGGLALGVTTLSGVSFVESDGADLWLPRTGGSVSRVRASDGRLLESWTAAVSPFGVLPAMGKVFVTGQTTPARLYRIDPSQAAGSVAVVTSSVGEGPRGMAFDGGRIWTVNFGGVGDGSVTIVTPTPSVPWTTTSVALDSTHLAGIVYDGSNMWVTDFANGALFHLDSDGFFNLQVMVGSGPLYPAFDGSNIWVPNSASNSVTVVRASSGAVLATLTGNGLASPQAAAFDGQRILVTNTGDDMLSLWKAADFTPIGFFPTGSATSPTGVCSDGIHFWIALAGNGTLVRF